MLQQSLRKNLKQKNQKTSTGLAWNIVATIDNYLMVLFSSSLDNFMLVDCILKKLFHTNR